MPSPWLQPPCAVPSSPGGGARPRARWRSRGRRRRLHRDRRRAARRRSPLRRRLREARRPPRAPVQGPRRPARPAIQIHASAPPPRHAAGARARAGGARPSSGSRTSASRRTILDRAPKWRNWQTRRTQNPVALGSCGFKSHLRHEPKANVREADRWKGSGETGRFPQNSRGRSAGADRSSTFSSDTRLY